MQFLKHLCFFEQKRHEPVLAGRHYFHFAKKKWKDKLFAAPVGRAEIEHGAAELGVDLDQHIQIVLDAMKANADVLGLRGTPES